MKVFILFFVVINFFCIRSSAQLMDQYQWKNRVILIFSDSFEDSNFTQQIKLFEDKKEELIDRDLVIFRLSPQSGLGPNSESIDAGDLKKIYQQYNSSEGGFLVVLIGKDGGRKFRSDRVTSPLTIFNLIDSMPMRRAEMRRKSSGGQ